MSRTWRELQIATRDLHRLMQYGCTNHWCRMVAREVGMHTNGPCHCVELLADLALEVAACAEDHRRRYGGEGTVMP
jgi:hypothetical protein